MDIDFPPTSTAMATAAQIDRLAKGYDPVATDLHSGRMGPAASHIKPRSRPNPQQKKAEHTREST